MNMTLLQFGSVLSAMSGYAQQRATTHRYVMGDKNSALLYSIAFMLRKGVEKTIEITKEEIECEKEN